MDEAKLEELKREHGDDLHVLTAAGYTVVAKVPTRAQFKRYTATLAKDRTMLDEAHYALALDCVVYPSRDEWAALADKRPGLPTTFGSELMKLAGLVDAVEAKKA